MMATRSAYYFVFLLEVLIPLIIFAQTIEPRECPGLVLNPMPRSDGTYVYNVSDNATINCADGDACPVSMSNVTWEVEPPNQDNEMRMNDIIFFTSLTLENNGTTIQCTVSCSNCSNTRTSKTVTLIVNDPSTTTDSTDPATITTGASQVTSQPNIIGISLYSSRPVFRPNYEASFFCTDTSFSAVSIQWLINGTLLENLNLSNAKARFFTGLGRLDVTHIPLVYNGTTIQCRANFGNCNNVLSDVLTLLVEGTLSAVESLSADAVHGYIILTWTAPYSVDATLSYCVEVNSTTSLIHAECGISTTEYSFPIGRVCSNHVNYYTFIVTPVNIAGNGESTTTNYTQSLAFSAPQAKAIQHLRMSGVSEVSTYQILMSSPVCYGELIFTDQDTGEIFPVESELAISGDTISIASEQLNINRHYNVTVSANNANGSALSHIMLSTHGVKDITADYTPHIAMTTEYFKSSTNKGALLFFSFTNGTSINFSNSFYLSLDRNASHDYTLPGDLTPGLYLVFAYDIESDGTLHNGVGYPADNFSFTGHSRGAGFNTIQQPTDAAHVDTKKFHSKDIKDCTVTLTGDVISATCSYSSDSAATGFQMIVQMKNTKADILLINQTTKYFSTGPVTVQVEDENGTYHVSILPLLREKGIVNATVAYTQELPTSAPFQNKSWTMVMMAVAVTEFIVIILLIIIVILLFYCCCKTRNDATPNNSASGREDTIGLVENDKQPTPSDDYSSDLS